MNLGTIHTFALAIGLLSSTMYWPVVPRDPDERQADGSEKPLHWQIGWLDSIGAIPADRFLFMPTDHVRPGPPSGRVPAGEYGATLDSAIARRLVFRETAAMLATAYSRRQQLQAAFTFREALAEPELLDSLWQSREATIRRLEGRMPLLGEDPGTRLRLITVRDAALLRSLPLSAWYELEALAEVRTGNGGVPRFFMANVVEMLQHVSGKGELPEELGLQVFADTTLSFATRLEYSRSVTRAGNRVLEVLAPSDAPAHFGPRLAAELRPTWERLRRERRLPTRYHWFDEPDAPGNPLH
ncbi:MAG: hypothetical protein U0704_03675 [Candidatus Eisenbacteria bacterium]